MPIMTYLKMAIDVTTEAPAEIGQVWNQGLESRAERINQHMQTRVPDEETYLNKLADRAEQDYQSYPDPTYISKKGSPKSAITAKHASNLKRAYQKFKSNWEYMFGNGAQRFKDKVAHSVGSFLKGLAARTLPFTGYKQEGRGPAAIAGFWLTGEQKVMNELRSGDESQGGPFRICRLESRGDLRMALNKRLIQAGAGILSGELADTTITWNNDRVNQLVNGHIAPELGLEPFATGGSSHVDFIKVNNQLFLEIQVSAI